jgi:hypothetical protein
MEYTTLDNRESIAAYLDRLHHATSISKHVASCQINQLSGSEEGDIFLEAAIDMLLKSIEALKFKYAYTGIIDKVPSNFSVHLNDSGFPIASIFKEMDLDKKNNFDNYNISSLLSSPDLKKRLVNIAMEERRLCRKTQFEISIQEYAAILSANGYLMFKPNLEFFCIDNDNGIYRLIGTCFDSAMHIPVMYSFDFKYLNHGDGKKPLSGKPEGLIKEFGSHMSSRFKLLTIAQKLDGIFEWLVPVKLDRIFMGPVFMGGITKHNASIDRIMRVDVDDKHKYIYCWTIESLVSNGLKDISSGVFSQRKAALYDLDMLNPKSFEAGVTRNEQSIVLPYELYQELADQPDNKLNDYKKYVVEKQGHVLVF